MGRLEAKGYVARATEASEAKQKWPGYKVTTLGLAVIREHLRDSRPKSTARDTFIEDEVRGERTL
jgi:hypothetical protein